MEVLTFNYYSEAICQEYIINNKKLVEVYDSLISIYLLLQNNPDFIIIKFKFSYNNKNNKNINK